MIDVHVHYFPPEVFRALWRFFEKSSHGLWDIKYKIYGENQIQALKNYGVERFTTLVYAHKPGMAQYLNDYVKEAADQFNEILPFGTIYAGDGNCQKEARKLFEEYNFLGIKMHPYVTRESLDDRRFFSVYEIMETMARVLVCHPGSGPIFKQKDGFIRLKKILRMFPNLKVVVAHCGAREYDEYQDLAGEFEHVYFDTAMNCVDTPVFKDNCPEIEFFKKLEDRVLFGTDFPNIPYDYTEQIKSIMQFKLGRKIEQKIFQSNAGKLFNLNL